MKFDAVPSARRRTLEKAQRYRGLTFTDRGEILLDVSNVKNGRVTLSQSRQRLSLLPETIFSINQAWLAGDIPSDGKAPWECSTFSAHDSEVDDVRCVRLGKEQMRVSDKRGSAEISISREQLKRIVDCIVEPWLANFSQVTSEVSRGHPRSPSNEIAAPQPQASQARRVSVADLS